MAALAFSVAVFSWFPAAMSDYSGEPLWLTTLLALALTPVFQPQFVAFALVRLAAKRRRLGAAATALAGAGIWVGAEWAMPKLFGDTLGVGFYPSRLLRQAADLAGPAGLSFVAVLVNEALYAAGVAAARREARRALASLLAGAAAIGLVALYGALRLAALATATTDPPLAVAIVQADIAHYDRLAAEVGTYEAVRRILEAHFAVSEELLVRAPVDLLVWPETVYPTTFGVPKSADGAAFDREIAGFAARWRRPLVFGSYDAEAGREYNAAIFLQPGADGDARFAAYRKASLFPLTERVPAWLDGPLLRRWLPWVGSWQPGAGTAAVDLELEGRRIRVAPLICYDAVDPRNVARAVREGAALIVTLSNDSWLDDGAGARLHLIVSAFRSIEARRPQVRATTTGVSAVIDPTGELVASTGVHQRAGLTARVSPLRTAPPPAVRWGGWLGPAGLALAVGMLAFGRRGKPRV